MPWNQLMTYQPPVNQQIKIIISGTAAELKSAMECGNYKRLVSSGIKVSTKFINDANKTTPDITNFNLSYYERLQNKIYESGDSELIEAWQSIQAVDDAVITIPLTGLKIS